MNIVPLSKIHDRKRFDCGDTHVTRFLREGALQDQKLRLSRTCVLVDEDADPTRILGFHTLVVTTVSQEAIPGDKPRIKRRIPAVLIGQLGVDVEFQGKGYGNLLLTDVEIRIADLAKDVGVRCLALDARNERLSQWYEKRDFSRFPGSFQMFKSVNDIDRFLASD